MLLLIKLTTTTAAVIAWYAYQKIKSRTRFLVFVGLLATVGVMVLAGCTPPPAPVYDLSLKADCPPVELASAIPPDPILDGSYRDGASYPC